MQQEEDEHRMVREQTILGKFMYKCSIVKSPRTKSDFEMLQANVQNWKDTEVDPEQTEKIPTSVANSYSPSFSFTADGTRPKSLSSR